MSIINDALKKTQQKKDLRPPNRVSASPPPTPTKSPEKPVLLIAALATSVIIIIILISVVLLTQRRKTTDLARMRKSGVQVFSPVLDKSLPSGRSSSILSIRDLRLDGIVYEPVAPVAIINGMIVSPGDTIAKAKVIEITERTVKLRYRREEIVLRLR